ncbi:hypothetical protein OG21DRAFT_1523609 [Imleria badia]|nr:hypothetical protein OG21DRAFT_1523609 [Imleria badia]
MSAQPPGFAASGEEAIVRTINTMSKRSRLPVVYIFGRKLIDVEDCVQELNMMLADVTDAGEGAPSRKTGQRYGVVLAACPENRVIESKQFRWQGGDCEGWQRQSSNSGSEIDYTYSSITDVIGQ